MTIAEIDAMIADRKTQLDRISGMVDGTEAGRSVSFSAMRKSLWDEIKELQTQRAQVAAAQYGTAESYGVAVGW